MDGAGYPSDARVLVTDRTFPKGSAIPVDMFRDWIGESYRAVAPASLVKKLRRPPLRE